MKPQVSTRKPLAAYLRLTVDRDGKKIGYDVQRAAIERWAAYSGETIGHWYQDKDVTAADRNVQREDYEKMLTDIEAGLWGGIVVWRLDRLVRLMYEFERCFRIVDDVDGLIVAIDPSIIRSDDEMGKLFMRLMVMFAEMEIATMKARAKGHRKQRAANGMAHGGGPRAFGFVGAIKGEDDRYLNVGAVGVEHNEEEAKLMQEAARRIAYEDWSWTDVLKEWASRVPPIMGTTGKPMAISTLQHTLTSLRAAGLREYEDEDEESGLVVTKTRKAVWKPIIDEATWTRLRAMSTKRNPSGPKNTYLLSGIALCDRCGLPLGGRRRKPTKEGPYNYNYYCKPGIDQKQNGRCGALEIRQKPVDEITKAFVLARLLQSPSVLRDLQSEPLPSNDTLTAALAIVEETQLALDQLAVEFGKRTLTMSEWLTARGPLLEEQAEAERTVKRISERATVPIPVASDYENLDEWFERLVLNQKRSLISTLIAEIRIVPGYSGPRFNPERVRITPRTAENPNAQS